MFEKIKTFLEFSKVKEWFRATIAEEVSKVNASLQSECAVIQAHLNLLDTNHRAFVDVVQPHVDVSRLTKENAELRATFKQLDTQLSELRSTANKL
jgi:hypothetical protein